jgi:hypothetical protein
VQQGSTLKNGRLHGKGKGDGIEGLSLQMLEVVRMSSLLLVPLSAHLEPSYLDANNGRCRTSTSLARFFLAPL